jgi:hypothetical protein
MIGDLHPIYGLHVEQTSVANRQRGYVHIAMLLSLQNLQLCILTRPEPLIGVILDPETERASPSLFRPGRSPRLSGRKRPP